MCPAIRRRAPPSPIRRPRSRSGTCSGRAGPSLDRVDPPASIVMTGTRRFSSAHSAGGGPPVRPGRIIGNHTTNGPGPPSVSRCPPADDMFRPAATVDSSRDEPSTEGPGGRSWVRHPARPSPDRGRHDLRSRADRPEPANHLAAVGSPHRSRRPGSLSPAAAARAEERPVVLVGASGPACRSHRSAATSAMGSRHPATSSWSSAPSARSTAPVFTSTSRGSRSARGSGDHGGGGVHRPVGQRSRLRVEFVADAMTTAMPFHTNSPLNVRRTADVHDHENRRLSSRK